MKKESLGFEEECQEEQFRELSVLELRDIASKCWGIDPPFSQSEDTNEVIQYELAMEAVKMRMDRLGALIVAAILQNDGMLPREVFYKALEANGWSESDCDEFIDRSE